MFYELLAAAAGPILQDVAKGAVGASTKTVGSYLQSSGFYESAVGQGVSSALGFLGIGEDTFNKAGQAVFDAAGNLITQQQKEKALELGDLPSVGGIGRVAMGASTQLRAGQVSQIPLGSGNTVPNYLSNSRNVRNMLSRVQTINIPRTNVAARPNIPLGSATIKSRVKVAK